MKIKAEIDIDLDDYKLAFFHGNSFSNPTLSQDAIMELAEGGSFLSKLTIALIPKEKKLTECSGDDWNDAPADCNATGFYTYPPGTIFLRGFLGQKLILSIN